MGRGACHFAPIICEGGARLLASPFGIAALDVHASNGSWSCETSCKGLPSGIALTSTISVGRLMPRLLRCGISIRPMTGSGHSRLSQPVLRAT
jgi:hypothetical protein